MHLIYKDINVNFNWKKKIWWLKYLKKEIKKK